MDLEHLRQFLVLAKTENMREAAEVLYISQPNLSRNLKALEAELGYPLFNRSRQRLSLNENGRQAQLCVQRIFQEIDKLQTMHRRTCERIPLSFIGKGSVYYDLLVPMLTNDLPEYEVSCITCSNQRDYMQAMRDTENGITYCTSGDVAELNPDFTYRYLMKDRICLSVPASCPLAARSSLRLDELDLGVVMMMTIKYFEGKRFGSGNAWKIISKNERARKIIESSGKVNKALLFALRLIPGFPLGSVSRIYGSLKFPYWQFILLSAAGFAPKLLSYTLMGA